MADDAGEVAQMTPAAQTRPSSTAIPHLVLRTLRNPLLRNGHLLTLSSGLSALIGLGYWVLTAWRYDPATVGRNYAAISMMMLLATLAQLDLSTAMVRFAPSAGPHTQRFVAYSYLVSASLAVVVSTGFLTLVGHVAPELAFLRDSPLFAGGFVCATAAYTIFVLQDSVLTGLRRTALVPLENAVFAGVKVMLVVILAASLPAYGIFASWTLSLVGAVLVISIVLFRWVIPSHQGSSQGHRTLPSLRLIVHFVAADYLAAMCAITAITLLPILVISARGPAQGAYFSLAWVIAFSLHLLNINMGSSLVVETAVEQSALAAHCRQVLRHTSMLLAPAIMIMVVLAPFLLGVFGLPYRAASNLLRLLTLASLPHLVVSTAVSSARAQRRMAVVVWALGSVSVLTLTLGWLLLHTMGLTGVGLAWLGAQSLIAGVLLIRKDLWLTISRAPAIAGCPGAPSQRLRWVPLVGGWLRVGTAWGMRGWVKSARTRWRERRVRTELATVLPGLLATLPALDGHPDPASWTSVRLAPTVSDLTVALLAPEGQTPVVVVKLAHSNEAAGELAAQRDALTVLRADPRLEFWRTLLPRVIEFRNRDTLPLAVETFLPGIPLAQLLARQPGQLESLMAVVLESIAHLHHRTGRTEIVDHSHLQRWVDQPLDSLRRLCLAVAPDSITTVGQLGEMLRDSLIGRRVQVSWTHGDFTPGNVLLTSSDQVRGIVDWGGARPGQPALADKYLMLLSASSLAQRRELGATVARRLRNGGLPDSQRRLLEQACAPPEGQPRLDALEEPFVILLSWLHHVAELQRKCTLYRTHQVWWTFNVKPVLRAVAALVRRIEPRTST